MFTIKDVPDDFINPLLPSKCPWTLGTKEKSPHHHEQFKVPEIKKTLSNVIESIGNTPLIKLNHIPKAEGIKCDVYVKCEFFNPSGSVKDRISLRMIDEAERKGLLKPGYTVIEPTAGNTGIGVAMICAVRGYKCVIVMPDRMSTEKIYTLKALGAEVVITPCEGGLYNPEGMIAKSQQLAKEIKNSVLLNQFCNAANPLEHYDITAEEILWQMDNKIDMFVCGGGTGGTLSGVGKKFKEIFPTCKIIGTDPEGSRIARPDSLNDYSKKSLEVEGIGFDCALTTMDRSVVDQWFKISDKESFDMARRLAKEEGILCGGTSGTSLAGALKACKDLKEGQRVVAVLPDGIRNYLTKYVTDNWMEARNYKEIENVHNHWWWDHKVNELDIPSAESIDGTISCQEAISIMQNKNVDFLPVVCNDTRTILGAITYDVLINRIVSNNLSLSSPAFRAMHKKTINIKNDISVGKLARILEHEQLAVVYEDDNEGQKVTGVLTKKDFIKFISKKIQNGS